jgi:hypothetical protein
MAAVGAVAGGVTAAKTEVVFKQKISEAFASAGEAATALKDITFDAIKTRNVAEVTSGVTSSLLGLSNLSLVCGKAIDFVSGTHLMPVPASGVALMLGAAVALVGGANYISARAERTIDRALQALPAPKP